MTTEQSLVEELARVTEERDKARWMLIRIAEGSGCSECGGKE
jgi:hypothetical protein